MSNPSRDNEGKDAPAPPGNARDPEAWTDAARARADRLHQRSPAPPPREDRRPWYQHLPAKLAAGVVFLVALTTLLGNLLELREKAALAPPTAKPAAASASAAQAAKPEPAKPAGPIRLQVALDRIAVQNDGSPGTTDWRFTVEADGQPLLAFEQSDLDDTAGRNVVRPKDAQATVRAEHDAGVRLQVKAWRLSRFRQQGEPDAVGEGVLSGAGDEAVIRVASREADGGVFVFYFGAEGR